MGTGAQEKAGPGSGLKEKDMNIVVLCGGLSTERNISLISGTKICTALRRKGHRAVLVAAAHSVTSLGASRTRGEGWVSISADAPLDLAALIALRAEAAA